MDNKRKVLFLTNTIKHYRVPILNILAQKYDLTVLYSEKTSDEVIEDCNFKTILSPTKNVWKFVIHKESLLELANSFDVVLATNTPTWISYLKLSLYKKRNFKLIYWNIGVPASYHRKYGEASKLRYLYGYFFEKRADGLIFYSKEAIRERKKRKLEVKNMFVAANTVQLSKIQPNHSEKDYILFIGTLYLEKGLDLLLNSYNEAYNLNKNILQLKIVGGGAQFEEIQNWIVHHNLHENIKLLGPIYDEENKAEIFSKAIACISPRQAGLAVLESMGYGVPFITMHDAITGGEAFNIQSNVNGLRLEKESEFKDVILDISGNKEKYMELGDNAYEYYWQYRTPEKMANGIIEAIENV